MSILKNYPYNGQADYWWLRSPWTDSYNDAYLVNSDGYVSGNTYVYWDIGGRRPAFVLPSSLFVSDDGVYYYSCGNILYSKKNINFALR